MAMWTIDRPEVAELCRLNGSAVTSHTTGSIDSWQQVLDKLQAFQNLEDDWDGLGAVPPAVELISSTEELARLLQDKEVSNPSRVVPGLDGGVILEWQYEHTLLELEISKPCYAEWSRYQDGKLCEHLVLN